MTATISGLPDGPIRMTYTPARNGHVDYPDHPVVPADEREAAPMAKKTRSGVGPVGWALRGAAAGAAGTTALNVVAYLDMAVRGRPASSTPERTLEKLAATAHVSIPGDESTRPNRVEGLGALTGLLSGIGVGGMFGLARASGLRAGTLLTTLVVLVSTNGPMTVLGITDPRTWSRTDWISDLVPHLAYGAVVATTMDALDRS